MSKDIFQELSNAQLKIGFIFQELMSERDAYEYKSEKLGDKITFLSKEIKLLKDKNKMLLEANDKLKKFVAKLFNSFLNLNHFVKNFKKTDGSISGNIQELYLNLLKKVESFLKHSHFNKLDLASENDSKSNNHDENPILNNRFQQMEDVITKEIESLTNLNLSSQFSKCEKLEGKLGALKKIKLDEKEIGNWATKRKKPEDVKPLFENGENLTEKEGFSLSKKNLIGGKSPVFKDLRNKKLEKNEGMRRLTQTLLNMDSFKLKCSEDYKKECKVEKPNASNTIDTKDDEDDVILDSPEKKGEHLKGFSKGKKKCGPGSKTDFRKSSSALGIDLDETYVSSTLVKNCRLTENEVLEKISEDQRNSTKELIREKSPKSDLVPFAYKGETVRKKAQRLDLPGHTCAECNQYYKEAWTDEFNSDIRKRELLNKCSRHRNKFSPTNDDTPAGYWTPYLTSTAVFSSKSDTLDIF